MAFHLQLRKAHAKAQQQCKGLKEGRYIARLVLAMRLSLTRQ
jgi:hypothetical protein